MRNYFSARIALATAMAVSSPAFADASGSEQINASSAVPTQPAPTAVPPLPGNVPPPPPPPPPQDDSQAPPSAPPAPQAQPQATAPVYTTPSGPAASGQWVFTNQYGWVWMPYAQNYTYVSQEGNVALSYAYYPSYGWRWLASPWVLGWGPAPYWGTYGYSHFAWHAHPWFTIGVYQPGVWQRWGGPYGHGGGPAVEYAHPSYRGPAAFHGGFSGHGGYGGHHR